VAAAFFLLLFFWTRELFEREEDGRRFPNVVSENEKISRRQKINAKRIVMGERVIKVIRVLVTFLGMGLVRLFAAKRIHRGARLKDRHCEFAAPFLLLTSNLAALGEFSPDNYFLPNFYPAKRLRWECSLTVVPGDI
jgi:hypothetical protein